MINISACCKHVKKPSVHFSVLFLRAIKEHLIFVSCLHPIHRHTKEMDLLFLGCPSLSHQIPAMHEAGWGCCSNPWLAFVLHRPQSPRLSAKTGPPNLSPTTLPVHTPYAYPKTVVATDNSAYKIASPLHNTHTKGTDLSCSTYARFGRTELSGL